MKKAAFLLIILSLMRIGVVYADAADNTAQNQDYFFGVKNASSNLNQVLALLVGPAGIPGPAGVAGKDGLIGMNGEPGLPGAPGAAGRDGVGVLATAFTGAQGTCTAGGTRFVDAAGAVTYACNGAGGGGVGPAGPAGPAGPQGPAGPAGTGVGIAFGNGKLGLGTCETDNEVFVGVQRKFTGDNFYFNRIQVGDSSTDGDLESTNCGPYKFTVYFEISASPAVLTAGAPYTNGDLIACETTTNLNTYAGWANRIADGIILTKNDLTCTKNDLASAITLEDISTSDFTGSIGFSIG